MGRILTIADCFDAMTARRPYKHPQSIDYARNELKKNSGTQFDPELVPVFLSLIEDGKDYGVKIYENSCHSVISNIMRSMPLRFWVECLWNILFKKCGISNQPVTASAMIRVFPSLEHSTDCVRKPTDNFRTFVCPLWHQ